MKPARENDLVDLLDRLVTKGLVLNADLIISVAGVPLIGVNLKAALASIETMLDYGMMEAWDKSTREWYAEEYAKKAPVPLMEGEEIIHRTFGSIWYDQGIIRTWRPGFWYLTNERLFLWRKEPAEMLFETSLDGIEALMISTEPHFKKAREVLAMQLERGEVARVRTSDLAELKEAVEKACARNLGKEILIDTPSLHEGEETLMETNMWYLFPAMGILGETWKPGRLCLTGRELYWVYSFDDQRMFEVPLDMITGVEMGAAPENPNRSENVLTVTYNGRTASFSGEEQKLYRIKTEIEGMAASPREELLVPDKTVERAYVPIAA